MDLTALQRQEYSQGHFHEKTFWKKASPLGDLVPVPGNSLLEHPLIKSSRPLPRTRPGDITNSLKRKAKQLLTKSV
jgi:hypothetical protein